MLMQDMYCKDSEKLHYKEFAERMKYLKNNKEGEEKITDIIEAYVQKLAKQAAKESEGKAGRQRS